MLAVEQPHDRRDGDRLGREPRRDPDGLRAPHDRQVHRHLLHDVQARQVPHAHRARRRARAPSKSTFRIAAWSRCRPPRSTTRTPAAFAWARDAAEPGRSKSEMLSRLMMRFGTPRAAGRARPRGRAGARIARRATARGSRRARDGVVEAGRRRPVRSRVAARRPRARPRRASPSSIATARSGVYFVRYADPDADMTRKDATRAGSPSCSSGRPTRRTSRSSTGSRSSEADAAPASSACRTRTARPTRRRTSERILALLKDQLK